MTIYLSENIKRLRTEKGITQENLAEFLGVSFQSVSNWERSEAYPDITLLPMIALYFNVTVDEILGMNKALAEEKTAEYLSIYENRTPNWHYYYITTKRESNGSLSGRKVRGVQTYYKP